MATQSGVLFLPCLNSGPQHDFPLYQTLPAMGHSHGAGGWQGQVLGPGREQNLLVLARPQSQGTGAVFSRQLGLGHIKNKTQAGPAGG